MQQKTAANADKAFAAVFFVSSEWSPSLGENMYMPQTVISSAACDSFLILVSRNAGFSKQEESCNREGQTGAR